MKFKKVIALMALVTTVVSAPFSVRATTEKPTVNMDMKHPDVYEISYVDDKTATVYKKEKLTSYLMNYMPEVYAVTRTKTSAYIDTQVFSCSLMTTVQVAEDKNFSKIVYTKTVPNKAYMGKVVGDYYYTEHFDNTGKKTITFTRVLSQVRYGDHYLSYRQIDITKTPSKKLVITDSVANSIKKKISNKNTRKSIRITSDGKFKFNPNKTYYFRVRNIYDGFGSFHMDYPYRVNSLPVTCISAPLFRR